MSQSDTVALFVNEAAMRSEAGDLEKNAGNLTGVLSVQVDSTPAQQNMGPQPSMVKRATITYDTTQTNPQALRAELEDLGYAVTAVGDVGE